MSCNIESFNMHRYCGILWKIKEIELMTENCADIFRFLSYRSSSVSNDFIILNDIKRYL